jgi:NAD(P)-dependent dehydrogenase (short-subunit alcohol dehydrogenase family)
LKNHNGNASAAMANMGELFNLAGKNAVVTGSSRGIGQAIAEAFAAHGANVVISSRNLDSCAAVAAAINARSGGRAIAHAASIGIKSELEQLAQTAKAAFGDIDILVCNAASNPHHGPMASITDAQFEKILRNNILANHWLVQLLAPGMIARRDGAIILIGSIGGYRGSNAIGAYNVTKAADFQLARNLAVEFGPHNVRVNCIAPGLIRTDFARALWEDEANLAKALAGTPLGRIGEPEDIAGAAVFLASPGGRYITGATLVVDGGATVTVAGI